MSTLTLINNSSNDLVNDQQQQYLYHHHHLHHVQSMPPPPPPPPLPLNNNKHLAKYLSKSSSRIDQDQKVHHNNNNSNSNNNNNNNTTCNTNSTNDTSQKKDYKEIEKKRLVELYNEMKLDPLNFHSMETFGKFIRFRLNLKQDLVNQILTNPKVQYWIDRNKQHGFVYQTVPKIDDDCFMNIYEILTQHEQIQQQQEQEQQKQPQQKIPPPIRCDLCKFYGHLSHTCTVKELAFKLNNVVLRNGACRCHICGLVGHPAEAGLCPYIVCSFCHQNGHWNFMCPHKDKISRTLCHRCQRYGHLSSSCPDQWRQFDRVSTYEQTPYRDVESINKPVYCYQCAQKGHYGYNCPDFHRKYFIRDYHHLDNYPVYFFASASPFVKYPVSFTDADRQLISNMVDAPIDMRYTGLIDEDDDDGFDTLEELEKLQQKTTSSSSSNPFTTTTPPPPPTTTANEAKSDEEFINSTIFNETHKNIPLKEYIRKWSNWVIDFHWVFTLKYFIDSLPTYKLHYFIKNYPSLDNFILHWMWWSYTLSRDLERFSKDPFRGAGTMPWLILDNKLQISNLNKSHQEQLKVYKNLQTKVKTPAAETECDEFVKREKKLRTLIKLSQRASKFFQYSDTTMKNINSMLFPNEVNSLSSIKNVLKTLNNGVEVENFSHHHHEDYVNTDDDDDDEFFKEIDSSDTEIKNLQEQINGLELSKGLQRSKSCNAIFYHGGSVTKQQQQQQQQMATSNKLLLESHLADDFKSKSHNNSPYLIPKLNLYKKSKQINNKKIQQKLQDFEEAQQHHEQGIPSKTVSDQLKLNYVHDVHHFQNDELTTALLNRLDSYGNFHKEDSESSIKTTTATTSDTVVDDDEQDKTIVFELGCCDRGTNDDEDDDEKTEAISSNDTTNSSNDNDDNDGVNNKNETSSDELSKKIIINNNSDVNLKLNFLLPNADLKNINQTIIVNSLTSTTTTTTSTTSATDSVNSTANSIFAKLLVPISTTKTIMNNNDNNNNNINNSSSDNGSLKDASLKSLLDLIGDKTVKLNEETSTTKGSTNDSSTTTAPSLVKERLRLDSTNLIKILLKIDNNNSSDSTTTTTTKLVEQEAGDKKETQKQQRQNEFNNLLKTSNYQNKGANNSQRFENQNQNQSNNNNMTRQNNRNYQQQNGYSSDNINNKKHYNNQHHHNHHQQQQQHHNGGGAVAYHNGNRSYNNNNNHHHHDNYFNQNYYNRKQQQPQQQHGNNRQHHQQQQQQQQQQRNNFKENRQPVHEQSNIFKKSKSNDMCTIKSLMSHSTSLGNTSVDRVLNDYSNSLTVITQQKQQNASNFNYPAMFSSSSNSTASSSGSTTKFSSSSSMSSISKTNQQQQQQQKNYSTSVNNRFENKKPSNSSNNNSSYNGKYDNYARRYDNTTTTTTNGN